MNLNMIIPKNETEDLLLSITKNCETLIDQTHRKAEETLEFIMVKPKKNISFLSTNSNSRFLDVRISGSRSIHFYF